MPEGDTLYRTAAVLRRALKDTQIVAASTSQNPRDDGTFPAAALVDRTVTDVEPRGKHLLIHLDDGHVVHTHLGMTGSWHTYGRQVAWQKPARRAALALENAAGTQVICFSPKQLEFLTPDGLRRHRWISQLGPDILAPTFDPTQVRNLWRRCGNLPLGVAVMDQRAVCGIGNVYKSEILFLERHNPFGRIDELNDQAMEDILKRARQLMLANLSGRPRRTRFGRDGARKWVYGRSGKPCFECGCSIAMRRQGDLGRSTYYCPECQHVAPTIPRNP